MSSGNLYRFATWKWRASLSASACPTPFLLVNGIGFWFRVRVFGVESIDRYEVLRLMKLCSREFSHTRQVRHIPLLLPRLRPDHFCALGFWPSRSREKYRSLRCFGNFGNCRIVYQKPLNQTTAMAAASAPDHEIITVTSGMVELRQQCYDVRVAVFVDEQGEFAHWSWIVVWLQL